MKVDHIYQKKYPGYFGSVYSFLPLDVWFYRLIFVTPIFFSTGGPSGFRTEGIASSAFLSLRERRDRTPDDEIPSVRNPDAGCL